MKSVKATVAYLEKRREAIGKERDKLRDVIDDYRDLCYSADAAIEHLDAAIEELSCLA